MYIYVLKEQNNYRKEVIMETLQKICLIFTIIGGLNWGLIGAFNFNLVTTLFGDTMLTNLIYIIVGICSLINIMILFMHIQKEPE